MIRAKDLRQLRAVALALPVDSTVDLESSLRTSGRNRGRLNAASEVTFKHVLKYLGHLSKVLTETLAALGNPEHWRYEHVVDPSTQMLRRPKVYLDANVDGRGSLYIACGSVPTAQLVEGSPVTLEALSAASDFRTVQSTRKFVVPGHAIVTLAPNEYPSRPEYSPEDSEYLLHEEACQREAFGAFLAAIVAALRAVLDVRIVGWVEFDDRQRLIDIPFEDRVLRLATSQNTAANVELTAAKQRYRDALVRADVTADELDQALTGAEKSSVSLQKALVTICGHKVHATQLRLCVRAKDELSEAAIHQGRCQAARDAAATAKSAVLDMPRVW